MDEDMKDAKAFDDYIEAQPVASKELLLRMADIILEAIPMAEKTMNYGVPAFRLVPGGKREEQVMFATFKKHIGLYPHPTTIEHFYDRLDAFKKSKGAIQFPLDQPLPGKLIIEMIRFRKALIEKDQ